MFAKAAIALVLLVGAASSGLAAPMNVQTVSTLDRKFDAFAAAMRDITAQGLFAEEYEAILEAAQDDPQLREKIIEYIVTPEVGAR
jgi:hypothetical protein